MIRITKFKHGGSNDQRVQTYITDFESEGILVQLVQTTVGHAIKFNEYSGAWLAPIKDVWPWLYGLNHLDVIEEAVGKRNNPVS